MKIKKGNLEVLFLTVRGTEGVLNLRESRTRDAFLKPLTEITQTFEAERRVIYEKFCTKKEDGTPDIDDQKYKFPPEDLAAVNEELKTLYSEEVEVPVLVPSALLAILERSNYQPKIGEAAVIDEVLAALDPEVVPQAAV